MRKPFLQPALRIKKQECPSCMDCDHLQQLTKQLKHLRAVRAHCKLLYNTSLNSGHLINDCMIWNKINLLGVCQACNRTRSIAGLTLHFSTIRFVHVVRDLRNKTKNKNCKNGIVAKDLLK